MKKIIIVVLLLLISTTLYALSPQMKLKQYTRGLEKSLNANNYIEAEKYFPKIDTLIQNYKLTPPNAYDYFKAKTYLENDNYHKAAIYAELYLNKAKDSDEYIDNTLDILDSAEKILASNAPKVIGSLMWQDQTYTQEEIASYYKNIYKKVQTWSGARNYCKALEHEGYSDWYLPNKKQLESLFNNRSHLQELKFSGFKGFWSSSLSDNQAWRIDFNKNGSAYTYNKSEILYVRCVRNN